MQVDREEVGGDLWGGKAQGALGLSGWAHQILKNNTPNHKSMTMSNLPKPNTERRNKPGEKMVMGRGIQGTWGLGIGGEKKIQIKNVPQKTKKWPSQDDYIRLNRYIFGCVCA